jgi:hypothetical protein
VNFKASDSRQSKLKKPRSDLVLISLTAKTKGAAGYKKALSDKYFMYQKEYVFIT